MLKKIFYPIITIAALSVNLQADTTLSISQVENIKGNSIKISEKSKAAFIRKIQSLSEKITGNGTAEIEVIIDNKAHAIDYVIIYSRFGDIEFKKGFKTFISESKLLKLPLIDASSKTLKIKFAIKSSSNTVLSPSIYMDKKELMYNRYIEYLIANKGYTKKSIRAMLDSKKDTISKSLLLAIYYDYSTEDKAFAKKLYNAVLKNKFSRFEKSQEGLFIADFLAREGYNDIILKLFPRYSCEFFGEQAAIECQYFRAQALYKLDDPSYVITLNLVKDELLPARRLYDEIRLKGGII